MRRRHPNEDKYVPGYIKLRTINRFLRWFGFRIAIMIDSDYSLLCKDPEAPMEPTRIGLQWYGWGFIKERDKDLQEPKA